MTPSTIVPAGGFSIENLVPYFQSPTWNPPLGFSSSRGAIFIGGGGSPPHESGGLAGGGSKPLGGGGEPPSGGGSPSGERPPRGGGGRFPIGGACVPFGAPWSSFPLEPMVPSWYPPPAPTIPVAPSSRKLLSYPIYYVGTNPNAHVQVFWKTQLRLMVKSETLM